MKISKVKRLLFYTIIIIFLLLLQELIFRTVFPVPEVENINRIIYSQIISDYAQDKRRYLSNEAFIWASDPDGVEFVHNLNLYGFRDKTWALKGDPHKIRVMFVGDSFVEGFMASDDETIPKGFEKSSEIDSMPVEVMNFGVGASDFVQYCLLIRDMLPIFKPACIILVFSANDFAAPFLNKRWLQNGIKPRYSNPFVPRLYYVINKLFSGESVALSWTKPPFLFFTSSNSPWNPWYKKDNSKRYSKFVSKKVAEAMKKGRFNPYLINGHTHFTKYLKSHFDITEHFSMLDRFIKDFSGRLMVVYIPSRGQVSDAYLKYDMEYNENKNLKTHTGYEYQRHAKILAKTCSNLNLPFLDLTQLIKEHEDRGERLYWNYDEHMRGKTYLTMGWYIYKFWKEQL